MKKSSFELKTEDVTEVLSEIGKKIAAEDYLRVTKFKLSHYRTVSIRRHELRYCLRTVTLLVPSHRDGYDFPGRQRPSCLYAGHR